MKQIIIDNISTQYYITEDGKCYNDRTGKYLKGQENYKNGYFSYNLTLPDGRKKRMYAHRLVAQAYIPNPNNKEQINHIDGNKLNNTVDNLEWVTGQENVQHSIENELKQNKHIFCFTKDKKLVAEYKNIEEAVKATKISRTSIHKGLVSKPTVLCCNYYWSYEKILGETTQYKNTGKAKAVNQYTKDGKYLMTYPSVGAAARALGILHSHIGECCRGSVKSYKGYIWRYVEDIFSPSNEN